MGLRNNLAEREQLATSIVTAYELEKGAKLSKNPARDLKLVHDLLSELAILELNLAGVSISPDLYLELSKKGKPIGEFDILIAATCLVMSQTIVTKDADFVQITNLTKLHY